MYYQALLYHNKYKQPVDQYGITYLDISNLIGKNISSIMVGDKISLYDYDLGFNLNLYANNLQVTSISRNLRTENGISLVVDRIRSSDKILENIIKNLNK